MPAIELTEENSPQLAERFGGFEDAVIVGTHIHSPLPPKDGRSLTVDITAADATDGHTWRLVRFTLDGLTAYRFVLGEAYSYYVLSDGLKLDCSPTGCLLDLDPGPDTWFPEQVQQEGEYSKQYAIGARCAYEIIGGPLT
ncbi:hypothetical protein [Streptomyces avicenniae]|uniref:hypothetical protein n=1 Tax=Streptomyces avicenniae TaxID=500153 RepID=UPI00069BD2A2|nr:hypothetical protein [Streptomyces avicenniae]